MFPFVKYSTKTEAMLQNLAYLASTHIDRCEMHTNVEGRRNKGSSWKYTHETEIEALIVCFINVGAIYQNLMPKTVILGQFCAGCHGKNSFLARFIPIGNETFFDSRRSSAFFLSCDSRT